MCEQGLVVGKFQFEHNRWYLDIDRHSVMVEYHPV